MCDRPVQTNPAAQILQLYEPSPEENLPAGHAGQSAIDRLSCDPSICPPSMEKVPIRIQENSYIHVTLFGYLIYLVLCLPGGQYRKCSDPEEIHGFSITSDHSQEYRFETCAAAVVYTHRVDTTCLADTNCSQLHLPPAFDMPRQIDGQSVEQRLCLSCNLVGGERVAHWAGVSRPTRKTCTSISIILSLSPRAIIFPSCSVDVEKLNVGPSEGKMVYTHNH